jgi:hypothetical protein
METVAQVADLLVTLAVQQTEVGAPALELGDCEDSLVVAPTRAGVVLMDSHGERSLGSVGNEFGAGGTVWFTHMGGPTEVEARRAVPLA